MRLLPFMSVFLLFLSARLRSEPSVNPLLFPFSLGLGCCNSIQQHLWGQGPDPEGGAASHWNSIC